MSGLPNPSVWHVANEYQSAAVLCHQNNFYWAAAINAALAVEIYLKSFISKEVLIPVYGGLANLSFAEEKRGHDLYSLYNQIDEKIRNIILEVNADAYDLSEILKIHKDTFMRSRYSYEENSPQAINGSIVPFSGHMRSLVIEVAKKTNPKFVDV